jgi:formate/nitrite transporter FocA (FNT family)
MAKRTREMLGRVLTLWGVVLLANLVGAAAFAWTAALTNVFPPEVKESFEAIAREAVEPTGWTLFARAIFAGWIIALMVWMLPAAESAQLFVIVIMTWLVGVGHFAHIIVGSIEVLYLVAREGMRLDAYLLSFMLPTLGGNMVGGVTLVAALNHAQVTAGNDRRPA